MGKMVRGWRVGVLAVVVAAMGLAAPAFAADKSAEQIEASMLVTGNVDIETDGSLSQLQIDKEQALPAGVVKFVRDNARHWKFEPVLRDGKAVQAQAPMRLRVVAKKLPDGSFQVGLRGVSFERYDANDPELAVATVRGAPKYPVEAFRAGAAGTVYAVVKVGRNGRVEDAVAEQVNLRILSTDAEMRRLRRMFADATLSALRDWRFRVPTQGENVDKPFWTVRIPVSYAIDGQPGESDYGTWVNYVPGPRESLPWAEAAARSSFAPDTLGEGGIYMADSHAPRLLTPLQGG